MRAVPCWRLIGVLFMVLPCVAAADPVITGVEGTLDQGGSLTLFGSSFGDKATDAPLRWDDFQDGEPGTQLIDRSEPGGGIWDLQAHPGRRPYYSGSNGFDSRTGGWITGIQRIPGDICVLQNYYNIPDGVGTNRAIGVQEAPSRTWYVSFWVYRDDYAGTAMQCTNAKVYGNFSGTDGFNTRWDEYWNGESGHIFAIDCTGSAEGVIHNTWGVFQDVRNRWIRVERFLDLGQTGTPDGYHAGATDLQMRGEYTGVFTPQHCAGQQVESFVLGHYFRSGDTEPAALMRQYISELYVDHSFARVEIGDAPTWNACTHREIQIPSAWSPGSITVTGNVGTFASGTQVYLYVVDADRRPSAGFPVTIGEDNLHDDPGPPGAPPGTVSFGQIKD